MKNRISYYLGQNGYLKMLTNLPEFTIFFKKEQGFISMIELVDMEENPYLLEDTLSSVTKKAKWRFLDQGYEEVHYLVLMLTRDTDRALSLGRQEHFLWLINTDGKKLVVPEQKAEDFYGMRQMIEAWLNADFDEEMAKQQIAYQANGRQIRNVRQQPLVNHAVFIVNVLLFTLCTLSGNLQSLYNSYDLNINGVLDGEWYRILTGMFLHADMSHLAGNMIMLFFLGDIVERELGHMKYFILYFLAGIGASAASLYLQYIKLVAGEAPVGSVGASGAIFGMLGGLLWLLIRNKGRLADLSFIRVLFLICYALYGGLVSTNVDNAAHFGGVLTGFLLAVFLYRKKENRGRRHQRKGKETYEN